MNYSGDKRRDDAEIIPIILYVMYVARARYVIVTFLHVPVCVCCALMNTDIRIFVNWYALSNV